MPLATGEHPIGANFIPGVRLAPTIVEVELNDEDVFDDDKARRDAISSFENTFVFSRQARCSWSVDAENVTKGSRGVPQ